ncbi:uncharacterized protein LTR77_006161 [Saxophila tyrrhenica]|uniref:N-acetyltransferase domain-containing protein n=1 Tax=Saxophila tyrrhenica TaxID=1690608 RepID=A0AAV9P7Q7_9PEZI|nr:hypothetical protein LTR77_006161 [Saxophila tyrrhenica]
MDPSTDTLQEPDFHEILTKRLRLRTLRVTDAEALLPLISLESVMRWTSHGVVSTLSQAERWTSDRALGKDVFNFAIELRQHDLRDGDKRPIIGVVGSFHLPSIGYMIHPDHAGNGYATEAFLAVLPQLFDRIPPLSEGGSGFDHLEGWADVENRPSRRILEKCGFTLCEMRPDPDNDIRGASEIAIYRKARPGRTLEELGLLPIDEGSVQSKAPTPPVQ